MAVAIFLAFDLIFALGSVPYQYGWHLQMGGFNENRPTAEEIRQGMANQR